MHFRLDPHSAVDTQITSEKLVFSLPLTCFEATPFRKLCRSRWSALIRQVYEVDPLKCPECGGEMKFVSFIEKRDQAAAIEQILKYCNLWVELKARDNPGIVPGENVDFILDSQYIPMDDFLENF